MNAFVLTSSIANRERNQGFHAKLAPGPAIRLPPAMEGAGIHDHRSADVGHRHRREYGVVQHYGCGGATSAGGAAAESRGRRLRAAKSCRPSAGSSRKFRRLETRKPVV